MIVAERNFKEGDQYLVLIPETPTEARLLDRLGNAAHVDGVGVETRLKCDDGFRPYLRLRCVDRVPADSED